MGQCHGELGLFAIITVKKKSHVLFCLIREKVESDLIFLGLLILENRLKEETRPVLEELISARIRTAMITGRPVQYIMETGVPWRCTEWDHLTNSVPMSRLHFRLLATKERAAQQASIP